MFHPAIIDPDEETDSEQSWIELQPRHTEMELSHEWLKWKRTVHGTGNHLDICGRQLGFSHHC